MPEAHHSTLLRLIEELRTKNVTELKDSVFRLRVCSDLDIPFMCECLGLQDCKFILVDGIEKEENCHPIATPITRLPSDMVFSPDLRQVEGSPLETKFLDLSVSPMEDTVLTGGVLHSDLLKVEPISTADARQLMADFFLIASQKMYEDLPVWIVCSAGDPQSTVMLGGNIKNGTEVESFSILGPERLVTKANIPSLSDFKRRMKFAKTVKISASSQFDVILPNLQNDSTDTELTSRYEANCLHVTAKWESVASILQKPPVATSKMTIFLSPGWGDPRSPIESVFKELLLLQFSSTIAIFQTLNAGLDTGEIIWAATQVDSRVPVEIRIIKLIEVTKHALFVQDQLVEEKQSDLVIEVANSNVTLATSLKCKFVSERSDLDFTERLWLILKDCESYAELVSSLKKVLLSLASGDLQPMVHRQNNTKLARMIRDSYDGNLEMPRLDGLLPLEILVEIGVEKLRRDYINAFCNSDRQLITSNVLEPLVSTDKSIPLVKKIDSLKKLHLSLEGVSLCQSVLGMSQQQQSVHLRNFISHYLTHDAKPHTFTFHMAASELSKLCERWIASSWQLNLDAVDGNRISRSLKLNFSVKPSFSHVRVRRVSKGSWSDDDVVYYMTTVESSNVQIGTKKVKS